MRVNLNPPPPPHPEASHQSLKSHQGSDCVVIITHALCKYSTVLYMIARYTHGGALHAYGSRTLSVEAHWLPSRSAKALSSVQLSRDSWGAAFRVHDDAS